MFRRSVPVVTSVRRFSPEQERALFRAAACRTALLGGHRVRCGDCGHEEPRYHSCRDRHCPTCRALPQAEWIGRRERRMLPTGHFHVVFTLPSPLRALAVSAPRVLYGELFRAASTVLKTLGREVLGGRLGITMVLHTWTRELLLHPHVHCIVTAGALQDDGTWRPTRGGYLFPVRRMAAMFRGEMLRGLSSAVDDGLVLPAGLTRGVLFRRLRRRKWVVYAKQPFGKVEHLVRYLGAYTHRVAISDRRVVRVDRTGLTFRTRDRKVLRLDDARFLARFALHVLPSGFRKIRHYGLYAPSSVRRLLPAARACLGGSAPQEEDEVVEAIEVLVALTGVDPRLCRSCGSDRVERLMLPPVRAGPRARPVRQAM
ncbi:MAG: IS91 family transposase [Planctomycetota bacterium]